jgi:hypothetical protein
LVVWCALGASACVWLLWCVIMPVRGVWQRVTRDASDARNDVIELAQWGPWVMGRREVEGGHQSFGGVAVGPWAWLSRRDHGVAALTQLGFPPAIATKIDGEVMAKLRVHKRGNELHVEFSPRKFDFTHQPPRLTGATWIAAESRLYRAR